MERRKFIQTTFATSITLLTGCKSFAGKNSALLYQAKEIINGKSLKLLKVIRSAFKGKSNLSVAYNSDTIGLVKLNEDEFIALVLVCSHRGCKVEFNSNNKGSDNHAISLLCPCHGAQFTQEGVVSKDHAVENLTTFITSSDDNFVYIHLS